MKKMIVGIGLAGFMFGVSLVMPVSVVQAEMTNEEKTTVQQQLISVLQELVSKLTMLVYGDRDSNEMTDDDTNQVGYELVLNTDLTSLDKGHYEGWLIVGEDKISTGKFGAEDDMTFGYDVDPSTVEKVVVTIEPEGDVDDIPSGIVVLAGDVVDGMTDLSFPVDFSDVAGSVILATPTNGSDTDETSGIWFLNLPDPSVSLTLPELPAGWVYEGWAVNGGVPLTSGRFTDVAAADDFDGYSGEEAAPAFPGEDYLMNAPEGVTFPINMADGESKIVISVEPDIDGVDPTGDGPAQVKPLLVDVALDQADHANIDMGQHLESVPSGTATLK